jgi:hypothetical protein
MLQTAVFVDAGYLFAAGSALLWGEKQPRHTLTLDLQNTLSALVSCAAGIEPNARLLRIYWYDGISPNRGPSPEQTALGQAPNIKLRLGFVNSQGQQKGVDSLIVTDLIDLARNSAISDALILAGDEDLRVGVQIAQTYGVRIHLLGIKPSRGNQSLSLAQEADSTLEWDEVIAKKCLTLNLTINSSPIRPPLNQPATDVTEGLNMASMIESIFTRFNETQRSNNKTHTISTGSLPREVDAPLLALARDTIGRDLLPEEKRQLRGMMIVRVKGDSQ